MGNLNCQILETEGFGNIASENTKKVNFLSQHSQNGNTDVNENCYFELQYFENGKT